MVASQQLLWQCVRNNNCFIQKRANTAAFTTEPGNMTNLNRAGYSGIANVRVGGLDIQTTGNKQTIVLTTSKKTKKPCHRYTTTGVSKNTKKAQKSIKAQLALTRPDLAPLANKKYSAIKKSFRA
ncbi:60S ribosomal protein L28, putative [Perkinsus marinus ATCC 50983]|uniref:60S ribosomal protein L28, putative n=1 Tax=Perkinsus marinus (strain ATCC 50983 / TXsc) TaxID=423536 RepID=C5L4N4_PERM5|nr:60S ribosomal protein L28, putative [Perkinsus marinus ATCC 50983]EER08302.1 60S ribosomal protein L28, putative [Perkinsus marinus ATCC 50983]|eukprot:XP_002776486.1 60S ribosomal protein L28, putative [Perkinsus marinus ATCC 50983]